MKTTPKPSATKKSRGELGPPPPPPPLPLLLLLWPEVAAEAADDTKLVGAEDKMLDDMVNVKRRRPDEVVCSQPQEVLKTTRCRQARDQRHNRLLCGLSNATREITDFYDPMFNLLTTQSFAWYVGEWLYDEVRGRMSWCFGKVQAAGILVGVRCGLAPNYPYQSLGRGFGRRSVELR